MEADAQEAAPKKRNLLFVLLKKATQIVLMCVIGFSIMLFGCQRRLMYHPQKYRFTPPTELSDWVLSPIEFSSKDGSQTAFFMRQKQFQANDQAPEKLWVCFNGNASLSLDFAMVYFENLSSERDIAFLLVDYPGYGLCEGSPSRAGIKRNGDFAYSALLSKNGWKPEQSALGVVGYSMGCAAGLEFAVSQYNAENVVLFAPFTSMLEMANRIVPFPFYYLAVDRFDNRARLKGLIQSRRTNVQIFHGEADEVIPVEMSRELAQLHPDFQLKTKPGITHQMVIDGFLSEFTQELLK